MRTFCGRSDVVLKSCLESPIISFLTDTKHLYFDIQLLETLQLSMKNGKEGNGIRQDNTEEEVENINIDK